MTDPVVAPPLAPTPVTPEPPARPRGPRRPIFGWIAFAFVIVAALVLGGAAFYAYGQTADAFIQGPPWWALTARIAAAIVGILCFIGLVLGIVGAVRREKPGWPAVVAMMLALPGLGYFAAAAYITFTVAAACSSPPGACGF